MPMAIGAAVVAGVGAAVSGGLTASFFATGVFVWSSTALVSGLIAAAGSLLVSAASMLLTKKPKSGSGSAVAAAASITTTIKSSNPTRTIVYGQIRVGGALVFASSTNSNQYLHLVIALAGHEIYAIDEIIFDETSIPVDALDSNGEVISGRYSGYARIKKHLGSASQAADSFLVAECSEWSNNHTLSEIAYIYVRLKYNQDVFPNGIPNISAVIRGKKVYDPRLGTYRFSNNPALMVYNYLQNDEYGFEASSFVDEDSITAAANICDEYVDTTPENFTVTSVLASGDKITMEGTALKLAQGDRVQVSSTGTIPAGLSAATDYYVIAYQFLDTPRIRLATTIENAFNGTAIDITSAGSGTITIIKTGEPRYHAAVVLERASQLGENLLALLTSFGGKAVYAGGSWRVLPAVYQTPTVTLNESDIVAPLSITTKIARSERFNHIQGLYYSHINRWQSSDYPPMTDSAAVSRDGLEISRDYDLPATFRPYTAQRLAKIELKKAVQEITVETVCTLKALQVQCGDTVAIDNTRMGWSAKVFEVTALNFTYTNEQLAVSLTLRETSSDIYDWSTSEESSVDTAPNTNLPNAFDVLAVTGLGFGSSQINTDGGDAFYNIFIQWDAHDDGFVNQGGQFEIQYKVSTETDYRPSFFVSGDMTHSDITQAIIGSTYDIRIRAVNNIGVRSAWSNLTGVVAGSSGGVTTSNDWGSVASGVTANLDWGSVASSATVHDDWGGVI